ncbi:hypothetical protein KTE19_08315 [Lentilactobacillus sp. IMAU92037]|uniref:hypothetical protein n=1 Tax=Lentilactobacillus dabitei TaxID=2831523 RepID=UPI001C2BD560|nr:hypothetical protein [Lentilactobacillus dabitei]MBV0930716.1 hypothetical protein [Lentilactobacillus dabitei]
MGYQMIFLIAFMMFVIAGILLSQMSLSSSAYQTTTPTWLHGRTAQYDMQLPV